MSPTPSDPQPARSAERDEATSTAARVRRARNGDLEALASVIEEMTPLLLIQARRRLGPRLSEAVDAEDVVQEAWSVALARLPDLRSREGRLGPVLFRFLSSTITRRVNAHLRRAVREVAAGSAVERLADGAAETRGMPAEATEILSRVIRGEDRGRVRGLVEALGPEERELLILRAVEGVPNQVAASFLGETPVNLAKRYQRLRDRLRTEWAGTVLDELE